MHASVRRLALVAGLGVLALCVVAEAAPRFQRAFVTKYPSAAKSRLDRCQTCHTATPPDLNPYGTALKAAHRAFGAIEKADSDQDGFANLVEIKALKLPGDASDKPGAASDSTRGDTTASAKRDSTAGARSDSSAKAPPDSVARRR